MWGPRAVTRPPHRSCSSSAAFLLKASAVTVDGSAPRTSIRWRRRSVRTRVLPEPAGAMTLAPPVGWLTAASWSGARSASGGAVTDRREGSRLRVPAVHDADPVGVRGGGERSSVDVEGRAVGQLDVGRVRLLDTAGPRSSWRPCARATRSALRCGRRSCSPTPGNGGAPGRTRSGGAGRGRADRRSRAPAGPWSRRRARSPRIVALDQACCNVARVADGSSSTC